jgi:hypothetical protein
MNMSYFESISLVNWGMGSVIIGVFALVCVVLVLVVYNMASAPSQPDNTEETSLNEPKDNASKS